MMAGVRAPGSGGFDVAALQALGRIEGALVNDSRRVRPGDVFVAYPGESRDGRDYIAQALAAGAASVIWEADGFAWPDEWQAPNLAVRGLRDLAGEIASHVHGHPSAHLWMIGVTGTNGKTSCSHWIARCLEDAGRPTAVVGTLGSGFPGRLDALANTTPDGIALHAMLARYLRDGARCAAMEVSSHGLVQGRVNGTRFDVALFTNLTRDHLDYHGDMERYFEAKARLFDWPGLRCAVINVDDAYGRRLVGRLSGRRIRTITYGLRGGAIAAHRLDLHRLGLRLEITTPWGGGAVESRLMGAYNASNLLGVLGVLLASDVPLGDALPAIGRLEAVPGRMQTLGGGEHPVVVIDYAHTPDALEQVLRALRAHAGGARLTCVFGCGGDRDRGKRPLMGEVATRLADRTWLTSDNPRSEDPAAIIAAIAAGAAGPVEIEPDREAAIVRAVSEAGAGEIVLVAGKGHESWQEIGSRRVPFLDAEVARRALAEPRAGTGSAR